MTLGELFYRRTGPSSALSSSTENFPAIAQDKPLRVTLVAGSSGLILPASRVSFTDGRFVYRFLDRKPGESLATAPSVEKRVTIDLDATTNRISVVP